MGAYGTAGADPGVYLSLIHIWNIAQSAFDCGRFLNQAGKGGYWLPYAGACVLLYSALMLSLIHISFFYGKGVPQDYAGSPDLLLSGKELFVLYGRQWSGKPYSAGNTGRYFKQRPDPSPEHLRGPGCGLHHVCVLYPVPERRYVG